VNELIMRSTPLPSSGSELSLTDKEKESPDPLAIATKTPDSDNCTGKRGKGEEGSGKKTKKRRVYSDYKRRITSMFSLRKTRSEAHFGKRKPSAESA
jgi:hypothetical protein